MGDSLVNDNELFTSLSNSNNDANQPDIVVNDNDGSVLNDGNLITLFNTLRSKAKANGFIIHDVPGDGNCLFSSVSYQLPSIGMQPISSATLRNMLVNHFQNNPIINGVHYCNFLPNTEYIEDDIEDDFEAQLCWETFLDEIQNGAWGDNIAVQGLSEMLNISISVIHSDNPNIVEISPSTGDSQGTIHVGQLGQLHYVALDRIVVSDMLNDDNDIIDNEDIEEGDEHNRQITGGPSESFMFLENPEADGQVFSVAPAQGQTPLSIMTDKHFEIMCNPNKFPIGYGAFNCSRDRKIT